MVRSLKFNLLKPIRKVHIIEDDDIAAFILQKELEVNDFFKSDLRIFPNAKIALKYLKENNQSETLPDLIFLDINMPEMDGWEYLKELEKSKPEFEVPIVRLTSSINPQDQERAGLHSSVKGFYSKPITQKKLSEISLLLN